MQWIRDQNNWGSRRSPPSLGQMLINAYWDHTWGYKTGATEALEEIALIVTEEHEKESKEGKIDGIKKFSETMAKGEEKRNGYEPFEYKPTKWA